MNLTTLEIAYIILAVCSFLLAAISIIIVVLTLRQNNKMIESSTRPYISVYGSAVNFESPVYYLVVKNFGQTGALIINFECNYDLVKLSYNPKLRPFEHLKKTFIAPGQSFVCGINIKAPGSDDIESIVFDIEYSSGKKTYFESVALNFDSHAELILPRAATTGHELKIISYALQSLVEKNL